MEKHNAKVDNPVKKRISSWEENYFFPIKIFILISVEAKSVTQYHNREKNLYFYNKIKPKKMFGFPIHYEKGGKY